MISQGLDRQGISKGALSLESLIVCWWETLLATTTTNSRVKFSKEPGHAASHYGQVKDQDRDS